MVLLLRKLYVFFTKDPKGSIIFQEGVQLFPGGRGGPNANFYIKSYTYLLFSGGGGCPDPLPPSVSENGQFYHNGTIFITVSLLTIIIRH